jgi:OOP family OmpA-OmpF porin
MPVTDKVGVFGKLGVARVDNSLSGTGLSTGVTGENKTGVYASSAPSTRSTRKSR